MVFVTGDIHADLDIGKLSMRVFPEQKNLSKEDYLIICGDFGLVWDKTPRENYWQRWLSDKNFTTLWVDGNHENFDYLHTFPLTEKFGGLVREITPSIYHLDRGQVLTIDGSKIFVMGGATSHDKWHRKEHISWWSDELPSTQEMERGIKALENVSWDVDYVITHCAPKSIQRMIADWYENDSLTGFFERVRTELSFKSWYFGHYHIDKNIDEQFTALYQRVIPIGETV